MALHATPTLSADELRQKDEKWHIRVRNLRKAFGASAQKKFSGELSGGMRKRVGLARPLVLQPELLIYDGILDSDDEYGHRLVATAGVVGGGATPRAQEEETGRQ